MARWSLEAQLTQTTTANGTLQHRYVLVDRSIPNGLGQPFRVKLDPNGVPYFDSQIPLLLGLMGIDESGTGVLLGPSLTDQLPEDRVRLMLTNPPVLYAELSAIASHVQAEARLGELASVGMLNGHGAATAAVQIEVIRPDGRDYITLTEMLDSIARPRESLRVTVDADAFFDADLYADFGTLLVPVDNPAVQPRISLAWTDAITNDPRLKLNFATLQPPTISNFSQLVKLKELTVRDVTDLIRRLVDLVERMSGEDLLHKRLPLVNTSIGEVLNTIDFVAEIVERIVNDPQSTLRQLERDLEQRSGLADHELTLHSTRPWAFCAWMSNWDRSDQRNAVARHRSGQRWTGCRLGRLSGGGASPDGRCHFALHVGLDLVPSVAADLMTRCWSTIRPARLNLDTR